MKLINTKIVVPISGSIIKDPLEIRIASKELSDKLLCEFGITYSDIYLVVDDPPFRKRRFFLSCSFDCGDEEDHLDFYEVELSRTEIKYLETCDLI